RSEAEQGLRIARDVANPTILAVALFAYGFAVTDEEPDAAVAALEESIALSSAGASQLTWGPAMSPLGVARLRRGEFALGVRALREAVDLLHRVDDRSPFYTNIWCSAEALERCSRPVDAARFVGIATAGLSEAFIASPGWSFQREAAARTRAAISEDEYH